jgi:hypothetical protein
VSEDSVTGTVRAPRQREIVRDTSHPLFQVDPLLMDSALQVAANWDGVTHRWVSIPMAIGKLLLGRPRRLAETARVRAVVRRVADPDLFYDVVVASEDGDLLMELNGVHLRRIAQLRGPA